MSLKLPPDGHAIRALLTIVQRSTVESMTLAEFTNLPSLPDARVLARSLFVHLLKREELCHLLVATTDGCVKLFTFGPRGGYKMRWNFGRYQSAS